VTAEPTPTTQPDAITFYWLATVQTDGGMRITCDGTMPAVPGTHTRMSTTRAVMQHLKDLHGGLTVLFLSLEPDEISAPARTTVTQ
jgi:hypothetical protein